MKRKRQNAPGRYLSAMLPLRVRTAARRRARKATPHSTPTMGMPMTQRQRLEEEKLLRAIAKLGRRNPVSIKKKKKSRKRRQPAALAKYWATKRRRKNARRRNARKPTARRKTVRRRRRITRNPRRRNLHLNMTLNAKQKRTLASFLRRATGRRVKVQ